MNKKISAAAFLYLTLMVVLWMAPSWPKSIWWLADLFVYAPLWVFFLPLVLFLVLAAWHRSWYAGTLSFLAAGVILFGLMGFNVPWPRAAVDPAAFSMKVVTANMGSVKQADLFLQLISRERPDVILFQELYPQVADMLRGGLRAQGLDLQQQGYLAVATRFKIRTVEARDRRAFGGWGNFIAKYALETPVGIVHVINVHLETPREGMEAVLGRRPNALEQMRKVAAVQTAESQEASFLATSFNPLIVGGDFNLTSLNPIFRAYWSGLSDAFVSQGLGFGYTKHTSWHGARIDHVLFDHAWQAVEAYRGEDVGGDHHPVVAKLVFKGNVMPIAAMAPQEIMLQAAQAGSTDNALIKGWQSGRTFPAWSLASFPKVSFSYKIEPGVPVSVRVQTSFGDWVCLGGSVKAACPAAVPEIMVLVDDGLWHKVTIDVRSVLEDILPGVKILTEVRFFDDRPDRQGQGIEIDNIAVFDAN